MTKDQAIAKSRTEFWKDMNYRQIAEFQIMEDKLCMPFSIFHEAVEKTVGRSVFTHEFGLNVEGIKEEIFRNTEGGA